MNTGNMINVPLLGAVICGLLVLSNVARADWMMNRASLAGLDAETSEVLISDDVVVADVELDPLREMDNNYFTASIDRYAKLKIVKSYKGVLKEQTTTIANLIWPTTLLLNFGGYTTPSAQLNTVEEKCYRLRVLDEKSTSGRYILFLMQKSGSIDYDWWAWLGEYHSIIPISHSISLETPEAKTISESVLILLDREWKRRGEKGEL